MTQGKFFKPNEVAKQLRVSPRSILRYVHTKKLAATKIGQWRIYEKDLERFIKSRMNIKVSRKNKK